MTTQERDFKAEGNEFFSKGEYELAINSYSTAIIKSPTNPKLFTNRALCYLRLEDYHKALSDASKSIELDGNHVKGFYYRGLAEFGLDEVKKSVNSLKRAYDQSINNGSITYELRFEICKAVLKAKKRRWEIDDLKRREENSTLYSYLSGLIKSDSNITDEERKTKLEKLDVLLDCSIKEQDRRWRVPDEYIGKIHFEIMTDPVITPSGVSFDRIEILEHLRKVGLFDPFTMQPLRHYQLIPNLALKDTIESFLFKNGWAIDY